MLKKILFNNIKMYTEQQYENEKNMMSKRDRQIQERFEYLINILIMYKQENRDKDVYLTEKCANEAVKYYQEKMSPLLNNLKK
tara:strand:+ start:138 stop:386 length:249 start_codon:yes stop_codon:yes gene_type:complete